ncbi:DUF697 domain-containing protein [Argonema galeatum]|uniref:slr1306 family protein n=1 Tax=Argonema galeatum TaxID=2942762 RepID=UPI002012F249|nr:DUF697 domain-containing protein [Argonema galeatum]MCL1463576.1 DUF697 domain-containing protein [Argonema galeatum A003/A1]
MTGLWRRPILVGGVGLSFLLWLWQSFDDMAGQMDEVGMLGAIALGGFWLFRKKRAKATPIQLDISLFDRSTAEKAIAASELVIAQVETEAADADANAQLRQKVAQVTTELDRKEISLAVIGGKGSGKTTLIQALQSSWVPQIKQTIHLKETPPLFAGTQTGLAAEKDALAVARASDLVLFVTTGDLTEPEFQTLQQLKAANQRSVLVFNKEDQYLPEERAVILQQLQQRMLLTLEADDTVAIAVSPKAIKVRQHQTDGTVQEWLEESVPEITALTERLGQILAQQSQQLVWATTWRAAITLKAEAKTVLNGVRRDRALPAIEQYQWIAAATAFANPIPALDLVATGAINVQLVLDLGKIYHQKFSLEQAQDVAGTMGGLMLKLGLVELSTQAITAALKSNAITFVAGGLVQGVSAAYLTRLAGLSLIEYFQELDAVMGDGENGLKLDRLRETLQKVFQQNQRIAFLQSFVKQVVGRLVPEAQDPQLTSSEIAVSN